MANSNFYEGYETTPYNIISETSTIRQQDSSINNVYAQDVRLTLNNWPLCAYDSNCINNDPTIVNDPTIPQDNFENCNLQTRTYGVTFETIRQNLASYNYSTDLTDIKHLFRTYYLEDSKTILQEVDMRTPGIVITKLSGDTGYASTLVKTTTYNNNREFSTTYSAE